jgi:hypothetical protein
MSLRPQQNIAAAQVGRYGTHATFLLIRPAGSARQTRPGIFFILGPIGLLCLRLPLRPAAARPAGGGGAGESEQRFI